MRPPRSSKLRSRPMAAAPSLSWCRKPPSMVRSSSLYGSAPAPCGIRICSNYWTAGAPSSAGEVAIYAVFEYADDTLASALAHAPLSEAEAREVLAAGVAALSYLQAQSLALPALDPDQVLAVGDTIKLSTDRLRVASPDTPYTAELRAFSNRISPSTPVPGADILPHASRADPHTGPPPAQPEIAPVADATVPPSPPAPDRKS